MSGLNVTDMAAKVDGSRTPCDYASTRFCRRVELGLIFTVSILSKIKFEEGGRVDVGLEDSSLADCKQVRRSIFFLFRDF